MTDEKDLISVATYLTKDETDRVKKILNSFKIEFLVSGFGPQSKYRNYYFQVSVKKSDYRTAKELIDKQRSKIFLENRKCPKCNHLGHKPIKKDGLWERILYLGTTRVQCDKCGEKFFV